jgi:PelA/Pel-15E family pectate lyase
MLRQPAAWYGSEEALRIADNLLLYQRDAGGWDKNIDMALALGPADRAQIGKEARDSGAHSTIDNDATYTQMRYLANVYTATGQERFAASFRRGFDYLMKAQYPNGGWPQFYPLRNGYWSHITYNDDAMVGVLETLRDIAASRPEYAFLSDGERAQARRAIDKGVECILRTQVVQEGKLTVWCAQHDEKTLAPAKARAYELPSLSGSESVGVVQFLMGIPRPSPEVVRAVEGAVAWFRASKLTGIRVEAKPAPGTPKGFDNTVVEDRARPLPGRGFTSWGRTGRSLAGADSGGARWLEIEYERRNGYRWYTGSCGEAARMRTTLGKKRAAARRMAAAHGSTPEGGTFTDSAASRRVPSPEYSLDALTFRGVHPILEPDSSSFRATFARAGAGEVRRQPDRHARRFMVRLPSAVANQQSAQTGFFIPETPACWHQRSVNGTTCCAIWT